MSSTQTRQFSLHPNSKKIQKITPIINKKTQYKSCHKKDEEKSQESTLTKKQMILLHIKEFLSNELQKTYSGKELIYELENMHDNLFYKMLEKLAFPTKKIESIEQFNNLRKRFVEWVRIHEESEARNNTINSSKEYENFKQKLNLFLETSQPRNTEQLEVGLHHLVKKLHLPASLDIKHLISSVLKTTSNPYLSNFYENIASSGNHSNIASQNKFSSKNEAQNTIKSNSEKVFANQGTTVYGYAFLPESNYFEGMEFEDTHKIFEQNYASMSFDWSKDDFN